MASRDDFVWPKISLQTFDGVGHLGKEVEASFNDHSSTENLNSSCYGLLLIYSYCIEKEVKAHFNRNFSDRNT